MAQWARGGRRPQAWWKFEAPNVGLCWPGPMCERSTLYVAGVLGEKEQAALVAEWRAAFDEVQGHDCSLCLGYVRPGDSEPTWLEGAAARRAHYREADIPRGLVRQWTAKHRRRAQTIRRLETAASREEPAP